MSNFTDLLDLLAAKFASILGSNSAPKDIVYAAATHVIEASKLSDAGTAIADAMAADTTAARTIAIAPFAARVKIYFQPDAALTAHASNYATITATKTTAAGASSTTVGTLTTTVASSGNLTALVRKAFVMVTTAGVTTVEAGAAIRVAIAKAASGVVVPNGKFIVHFEPV